MLDSTENTSPPNPPNAVTQIPRYKYKLNQNLYLNLCCEIPGKTEFPDLVNSGMYDDDDCFYYFQQ